VHLVSVVAAPAEQQQSVLITENDITVIAKERGEVDMIEAGRQAGEYLWLVHHEIEQLNALICHGYLTDT